MNVDRIVHVVAGSAVLAGLALAHFVHPDWVWLPVFVGANLAQSGITRFCPLVWMLTRLNGKAGTRGCCG